MSHSDLLPEVFAIQRRTSKSRVSFQILISEYNTRHDYYTVCDSRDSLENILYSLEKIRPEEFGAFVSIIQIKHPVRDSILEVNCWQLPYILQTHRVSIPVLEFQYRSWIPSMHTSIPIQMPRGSSEFLRIVDTIQQDRLEQIYMKEDRYDYREDSDERMYMSHNHTRNRGREAPTETKTVERIVVKAQILPKAIGDILLTSARKGEDSCPITSTPFARCKKLCVTSCFHIFENESLVKWNERNTTCPVCRCEIENVVCEENSKIEG